MPGFSCDWHYLQRGILAHSALGHQPGLQGPGTQGGKWPTRSAHHSECGFPHILCVFSTGSPISSSLSTAWHPHLNPLWLKFSKVTSSSFQACTWPLCDGGGAPGMHLLLTLAERWEYFCIRLSQLAVRAVPPTCTLAPGPPLSTESDANTPACFRLPKHACCGLLPCFLSDLGFCLLCSFHPI